MKAIVVDDSRTTRSILKRALAAHGFEIIEAGDGKQALEALEQTGPLDLALVDWNMPVMTGYEFIVELRARRAMDGMVVMMVSTETEGTQIAKALEAGANEYIMKPFSDEVLRDKLILLGLVQDA